MRTNLQPFPMTFNELFVLGGKTKARYNSPATITTKANLLEARKNTKRSQSLKSRHTVTFPPSVSQCHFCLYCACLKMATEGWKKKFWSARADLLRPSTALLEQTLRTQCQWSSLSRCKYNFAGCCRLRVLIACPCELIRSCSSLLSHAC